ncbi:MAG TPA: nucleotide excision repair endonuclease [Candidatus Angelobacter sp.]|nr:nucleotide excision repair endonuclease [Candidatus Angelobacter sp.]
MSAGQLWLFDPPKPLVDRLGEEFFTTLPTGPGVYLMCGETEGVLYVGKARNLRQRLENYRVANPERMPRRIIRLLHQVRRIEFDECPTEEAAAEREEQLICVLAPKFNAAGKVWAQLGVRRQEKNWRGMSKTRLVAKAAEFIRAQCENSSK